MPKRTPRSVVLAIGIALTAFVAWKTWKGDGEKTESKKADPLVSITSARVQDLPIRFYSQGHLPPLNEVEIRPQVSARIRSIHFREGDDVEAGQLRFVLDDSEAVGSMNWPAHGSGAADAMPSTRKPVPERSTRPSS